MKQQHSPFFYRIVRRQRRSMKVLGCHFSRCLFMPLLSCVRAGTWKAFTRRLALDKSKVCVIVFLSLKCLQLCCLLAQTCFYNQASSCVGSWLVLVFAYIKNSLLFHRHENRCHIVMSLLDSSMYESNNTLHKWWLLKMASLRFCLARGHDSPSPSLCWN